MEKDLAKAQRTLGKMEASATKGDTRAQVIEEALNEARNQTMATKEEVQATKVRASRAAMKVVERFKMDREYCQMVLDSCKKWVLNSSLA